MYSLLLLVGFGIMCSVARHEEEADDNRNGAENERDISGVCIRIHGQSERVACGVLLSQCVEVDREAGQRHLPDLSNISCRALDHVD